MQIKKTTEHKAYAIKITAEENGQEIGRVYLYILNNNLHREPFGLVEDLFVEEKQRGKGIGTELMQAVIAEARELCCYKLIGQSRYMRDDLHRFYERLGFTDYGKNFRIDFLK